MCKNTCYFFRSESNKRNRATKNKNLEIIEKLIVEKQADTFLFGSKRRFDSLYHETVTELKEKYPHIKRVYVRAEYSYISDHYMNYLPEKYEDTYYPKKIRNSGRASFLLCCKNY